MDRKQYEKKLVTLVLAKINCHPQAQLYHQNDFFWHEIILQKSFNFIYSTKKYNLIRQKTKAKNTLVPQISATPPLFNNVWFPSGVA
jgi:phosphopantothenoylcysteine synthetase/decarboxylase